MKHKLEFLNHVPYKHEVAGSSPALPIPTCNQQHTTEDTCSFEVCPDCGSDLCAHGVCVNYCHDETCRSCMDEWDAHNLVVAEVNAVNRMAILVGGFPDEEDEQVVTDPPEPSEFEKRKEKH